MNGKTLPARKRIDAMIERIASELARDSTAPVAPASPIGPDVPSAAPTPPAAETAPAPASNG